MMGVISWTGAALMVVASFLMSTQYGPMIAVAGLGFLTIQSVANRTHNLTALNICSILGVLYSITGFAL